MKNSKLLTVQNHEILMENRRMYQIMKIEWKIVHIRCTDHMNLFKTLNSLNIQNRENSMKILYIRCTDCSDLSKGLNSLNVQILENLMENRKTYQVVKIQLQILYKYFKQFRWKYKIVKTQGKIVYMICTDSMNLLKNSNSLSV